MLLSLLALVGCRDLIIHQLTELEANRLVTRLADVHISAEKVKQPDGTWALAVDDSQSIDALRFVNEARLVKPESSVPERASVLNSREDQRFRYERSLSHELESTINNIPSVLESRVHLNLPAVDPLFGQRLDQAEGSASVLVVSSAGVVDQNEVARLVAGASGVPLKNISVMIAKAERNDAGVSEGTEPRTELRLSPSEIAPVGTVSPGAIAVDPKSSWRWPALGPSAQIGLSLIIVGFGTILLVLRRNKTAGVVFRYEAK